MESHFSKLSGRDLDFLEKVVGSGNLSTAEEELVANAVDAYPGGFHVPEAVAWPETAEQVEEILRYADERRIPVYPRGSGTGLTGTVPIYGGLVLNLVKMNRVVEVLEDDMQVRVQPGVVYGRLNEELKPYGLFFPPDPASGQVCTVGGMVASNASGLKAVKYGTTREYVLGFEAVFAGGKRMRLGARTFKYSTGFDLVKMLVGSQGTLAVFTEITLRLRPLPEHVETAVSFFPSVKSATKAVYDVVRGGVDVAAVEFMDAAMMRAVAEYKGIKFPEAEAMLLVETHGAPEAASEAMEKCVRILEEDGGFEITRAVEEEERQRLWEARRGAYPASLRLGKTMTISDVIVPLSKLADAVEKSYEIGRRKRIHVSCIGHFGDGNLHVHWSSGESGKDVEEVLHRANDELSEWAISVGGAVSAEHGIGVEKKKFMKLQHGEAYQLMLRVKRLLDPNCILSPGIMFDVEEVLEGT